MSEYGLQVGTPEIKSVGAITFGPDDILFVADSLGAQVLAIDVAEPGPDGDGSPFELDDLEAQLAGYLGCNTSDVVVRDLAVHPRTSNIYLSVSRGQGSAGVPLVMRIDVTDGSISDVELRNVAFAQTDIHNAPDEEQEIRGRKMRTLTVTDLAYSGDDRGARSAQRAGTIDDRGARSVQRAGPIGVVYVSGLSNEEFSSNLRRIPFPFAGTVVDNSLEIFHVAHGAYETAAPITTLLPYNPGSVLASYTCTPLVWFALDQLESGTQAKGRTVAELGAGNQPVDMVSFDGADGRYVLVANSRHPLMKIAASDIEAQGPLTTPLERERVMAMMSAEDITDGLDERFGVPRTALPQKGVAKLANLGDGYVLMLHRDEGGSSSLRSYATSSL